MPIGQSLRNRQKLLPTTITGQRMFSTGAFDSIKAGIQQARNKVNEKRPGTIIPKQTGSSLLSPGSMSFLHERTVPVKSYSSRISFQSD